MKDLVRHPAGMRAWLLCLLLAMHAEAYNNTTGAGNTTAIHECDTRFIATGDIFATALAVFFLSIFIVDLACAE